MSEQRVDWVDYAKGICITLVVMMHATLSYGGLVNQEGWLHEVVEFARPFRMPDFFLLAGLFLGRSIHSNLLEYVDRKVIHFAYFYLLWLAIQMTMVELEVWTTDPIEFGRHVLVALTYEPYETLWFVHMLAVFYIVTRLLRDVPVWLVFSGAAALQIIYHADIFDAGWTINRFCDRYVYFFVGFAAAPRIFEMAERVRAHPATGMTFLLSWGLGNAWMVNRGWTDEPIVSLIMGLLGAGAVVTTGVLMTKLPIARPIAYIGANSIVVYLTFFFPVKVMHKVLLWTDAIPDVGWACLAITLVGVAAPLMFHRAIKDTPLNFLYVRPRRFRLNRNPPEQAVDTGFDPQVDPSSSAARGAK